MFIVLFLIFLTLKVIGLIAWSWWWVCSPLLIGTVFYLLATMAMLMISAKFHNVWRNLE